MYIYDIVPDDEVEKHKVLSKDEIKESKKLKKLLDTYKEAIEALKDAEKALDRCSVFADYDYDWLEKKIDKVLWAAKKKEGKDEHPHVSYYPNVKDGEVCPLK